MFFVKFIQIFFLSILLSVDDFAAGVSYGLRKATIPLKNLMFVVIGSASSLYIFMFLGKYLSSFFNDNINKYLSFFLLAGLGCRIIFKAWRDRNKPIHEHEHPKWSKPISIWEYIYLGASLGIDDFAEAVGLAVAGFPIALTVILLQVSEIIAMWVGSFLGDKALSRFITPRLTVIPGLTLIGIAIWQLF
jgi:putative Mn2+ efflux pump MntP